MWVSALRLTDFRSYQGVDLSLTEGVTTFVGQNGQGKTNLVEAIGYVAVQGSHRVATDAPLVRQGADRAIIGVDVRAQERPIVVEIEINPGRANRARINRSPASRARDALGLLRTVLFAPEDLSLVKGDPTDRRRFIDDLLVQRVPRLHGVRSDYERVLKQRNALLKSASSARRADPAEVGRTLDVWDEQLARLGGEIIAARIALVHELRPAFTAAYATIAGGDGAVSSADVGIAYLSGLDKEAQESTDRDWWCTRLLEAMAARRREEIDRAVTLVGPQRDDLSLTLGGMPAKGFASHGEAWSIALGLKLASLEVLVRDGDEPVLILDDVFAELDAPRRRRLSDRVSGVAQVLITAAVPEDVPQELAGRRLLVTRGQVSDA